MGLCGKLFDELLVLDMLHTLLDESHNAYDGFCRSILRIDFVYDVPTSQGLT